MNFKHISYFNYIKSNSKVFRHNYLDNNILNKPILEQVCKDLEAVENEYVKGVLLEGFPNNLVKSCEFELFICIDIAAFPDKEGDHSVEVLLFELR
jgi:hypothetical protein